MNIAFYLKICEVFLATWCHWCLMITILKCTLFLQLTDQKWNKTKVSLQGWVFWAALDGMHTQLHEKQSEVHLLNRTGQSQLWHQILFGIVQVHGNDQAGMFKLKWELDTLFSVQISDSRASQGCGFNAWSKGFYRQKSSIGRMPVACFGPAQRSHS